MPETSRHFPLLLELTVIQEDGILGAALLGGAELLAESEVAGATLMGEAGVPKALDRLAPRSLESVPAFLYGLLGASR